MTPREYVPRAFAPLAMDHFAQHERCALFAKPGMGKSVLTASYLDILHNVWGEDHPTLVLAPLRVARDGWPLEVRKWRHLAGLEIVPVLGTSEQRRQALTRDAPVFTTNYEQLPWLVDELGDRWPFRTVVADESTKLKGFRIKQGTARAQALGKVAHKYARRWINLTGTPASNGLTDLWGQTWFLDAGQRLGRTFTSFQDRWFGMRNVKDAKSDRTYTERFAFPHAEAEIHAALADICLTLDPKDWFDLKDPVVNVIEVDLPASARAKYRDMEKELFAVIDGKEVEAFSAAAKSQKCLQLANGAVYLDPARFAPGTWVEVHFEKLDALRELMDETGDDPLLVVYSFVSDRDRILRAFPDVTLRLDDAAQLDQAKAGKGKLWLAHPASLGHGVDGLQEHCNQVVFFAQDWNLEYHDQVLERVGPMRQLQAGKDRAVFVHYIVARKTIDEVVMARRDSKRSVQDLLMDYMKGKR